MIKSQIIERDDFHTVLNKECLYSKYFVSLCLDSRVSKGGHKMCDGPATTKLLFA